MATFNKFDIFAEDLATGVHDPDASGDTISVYLTDAAPSASADAVKADLAEISTGNGYTGPVDTQQTLTNTSGTVTITGTDITITASGGAVGPFRYVVLFNSTTAAKTDPLIGWWDYGSSVTLQDGDQFTIDFSSTILTIA